MDASFHALPYSSREEEQLCMLVNSHHIQIFRILDWLFFSKSKLDNFVRDHASNDQLQRALLSVGG
jgi:hypothetical protein